MSLLTNITEANNEIVCTEKILVNIATLKNVTKYILKRLSAIRIFS